MKDTQLATLLGFLFVAAWAALGFGDAVLCLVGAAAFYAIAAFHAGDLNLNDLQRRAGRGAQR